MSDQPVSISNSDFVNIYLIKVKGCLDSEWSHWFEGLTITQGEDGITLLAGRVVDDAALHVLLNKIRDLGMPLLSTNVLDTDHSSQSSGIAGNKSKGK